MKNPPHRWSDVSGRLRLDSSDSLPGHCTAAGLVALAILACPSLPAQLPAFPGAEGFGAHAVGGRFGDVYTVTNLDSNGPGSLRYGVENAPAGGRTIVFAVSGYIPINYNSDTGNQTLRIVRDNVTIAGQTAPGDGIGLKDGRILMTGDNCIIRNLRIRHGKGGGAGDCLNIEASSGDSIIDHVSMQFSTDENISFFNKAIDDFTMQNSVSAWGLESHNAGGLWDLEDGSCHHSLWAHHKTRNPKARPYGVLEWVNNVTFDWGIGFIMGDSSTPAPWKANVIGSYFLSPPGYTDGTAIEKARIDRNGSPNFSLHLDDCLHDSDGDGLLDGTDKGYGIVQGSAYIPGNSYSEGDYVYVRENSPFPGASGNVAISVDDPLTAYKKVVSDAGAVRLGANHGGPLRDEVDTLLFSNVVNQVHSRISDEDQLPVTNAGFGTLNPAPAPSDSDLDGMPNFWEDALGQFDHDDLITNTTGTFFPPGTPGGYTRLEEYLHFKMVPHAVIGMNTAEVPSSLTVDLRDYTSAFSSRPGFDISGVTGGTVQQFASNGTTPSGSGPIITFTPTPDSSGRAGFDFEVTDAEGSSWTRQFAILVTTTVSSPQEIRINVEFDEGAPHSGTAAAPDSGTVWNIFPEMSEMSHTLTDVASTTGASTPVDVAVTTTSGDGFKVYTQGSLGNPNPVGLMGDYAYGGTFSVTVSDLPEGSYQLYVYAHGDQADQGSLVTISAANGGGSATAGQTGSQYRNLETSGAEGYSYLRFDPVVGVDGTLEFTVGSGTSGYFNGFQLVVPTEENYFVNLTDAAGGTGDTQTIGAMPGWGHSGAAPVAGETWNVFDESDHAMPGIALGQVWTMASDVPLTAADGAGGGARMTVSYHAATDAVSSDRLSTLTGQGLEQAGGVMDKLMRNYYDRSGNGNFQRFSVGGLTANADFLLYAYGGSVGSQSWKAHIDLDRNGTVDLSTTDGLSSDALFEDLGGGDFGLTPQGQVWNMGVISADAGGTVAFDSRGHLCGFQLMAFEAPSIQDQPGDQQVHQGQQASFVVVAEAKPAPAYQWYKDGQPISGATASSHTISNVAEGDLGDYQVEVSNVGAMVMSAPASLSLIDPYVEYVEGFELDPETDGAPGENPDFDLLVNALEHFLGGDPTAGETPDSYPRMRRTSEGPEGFVFEFERWATAADVPFVVEYTTTLDGAWMTAVDGVDGVSIEVDSLLDGDFDRVTVTIPSEEETIFGRLRL